MPQFPLSVVIITKNEEENIRQCLESVKWADEIIVVDDESADKTREIAREWTEKIIVKKMENEGRHRNWAYAQAKNEWVLSLDADERVTKELKEEICQSLKNNSEFSAFTPLDTSAKSVKSSHLKSNISSGEYLTGFTIPRKNFLGNYWLKFGGEYPAGQLKLFKKTSFRFEEVDVHPRAFLEGKCGHLQKPLLHYSSKNFADFLNKFNSQTTLEARKWVSTNRKMSLGHALWRTIDRFFRKYLRKKGYKDGFIGFMLALFAGLYQIISYAKYWEENRRTAKLAKTQKM